MIKYPTKKIETWVDNLGIIHQDINTELEGEMLYYTKSYMDVREKHIRDALISLGWTPPGENNGDV